MSTKKSYLVTGGSGFIGAALVARLLECGHRVRVLDNGFRGRRRRLIKVETDIDYRQGDIRDKDVVSSACEGVDVVCHLAFVNGTKFFYSEPELVLDVGVKGMVNILDASVHQEVKEFILMSSSEVYQSPKIVPTDETVSLSIPDPLNPRYSYGGGKIISELMLIHYGPRYFEKSVIIRPHNVYGPDMGWEHVIPEFIMRMKHLASESQGNICFPIQGTGEETRAFVYIDDFVDGAMVAMDKGQQQDIFHVGSSDEITIKRLAQCIGAVFAREVQVVPSDRRRGGTLRRCPDIGKLRALGYRPRTSLAEGLASSIEWYTSHGELAPSGESI